MLTPALGENSWRSPSGSVTSGGGAGSSPGSAWCGQRGCHALAAPPPPAAGGDGDPSPWLARRSPSGSDLCPDRCSASCKGTAQTRCPERSGMLCSSSSSSSSSPMEEHCSPASLREQPLPEPRPGERGRVGVGAVGRLQSDPCRFSLPVKSRAGSPLFAGRWYNSLRTAAGQ